MSKTLNQVIMEQFPDFDGSIWPVVVNRSDGNGIVFDVSAWPTDVLGEAPTDEQLELWMSE